MDLAESLVFDAAVLTDAQLKELWGGEGAHLINPIWMILKKCWPMSGCPNREVWVRSVVMEGGRMRMAHKLERPIRERLKLLAHRDSSF